MSCLSARLFSSPISSRHSPVQLDLVNLRPGIHNGLRRPGEPSRAGRPGAASGASEDGEAYVLVTHVPRPADARADIVSFTSNRTPGRLTAVEWFTNPTYARTLVAKMRKPSGEIPRYYQVVLKVRGTRAARPPKRLTSLHHELQ